jgi:hypothetical protein
LSERTEVAGGVTEPDAHNGLTHRKLERLGHLEAELDLGVSSAEYGVPILILGAGDCRRGRNDGVTGQVVECIGHALRRPEIRRIDARNAAITNRGAPIAERLTGFNL